MRKTPPSLSAAFVALLLFVRVSPIVGAGLTGAAIEDGGVNNQPVFDQSVEEHEKRAREKPNDPESWYTLARFYSETVQKDNTLATDLAKTYVLRGLEANERALTINPVYYEALGLKSTLLRQRALYETDPSVRKRLIAEADAAAAKAAELLRMRGRSGGGR